MERGYTMAGRFFIIVLALAVGQAPLFAEVFRFAYTKGEKYHILSTVAETVTVNGRFDHKSDILNKIAVEVTDTKTDSVYHIASFQTSETATGSAGTFALSEDYASEFWRNGRGAYTMNDDYFMPVVRDVPLFPEGDVAIGQSWSAPGSEVHDFRRSLGMKSAFHIPITVSYTYLRNETRNSVDCAVIGVSYNVFYKVTAKPETSGTYPVRVTGSSQQTYWWDLTNKRLLCAEENFDFIFTLVGGDEIEFSGQSKGEQIEAKPLDRQKAAQDIQKELQDRKIENASVRPDVQGVTITLENVNFPPNSDTLLPAEQEKLRRIAEILKKYPDRDILITGHTAAVSGYTEEEHQLLSEKRAKAAGDFLLSIGARQHEQVTYRGMGDRVPIADNSTEEGRAKNRRVEITILEN
jgi:outer membrane protein OmpA-like peptidoglycan-associated protein